MDLSPANIRKQVLTMSFRGQSVHVPSAFSIVEILSVLYEKYLLQQPEEERDRFVLSKGHGTMSLYVILKEMGLIEQKDLDDYFQDGSKLHGLPEISTPGIEATSGSLGHGLPIATGMALGFKSQGSKKKVYCLVGDGEMNEGPIWEALLFAKQQKLSNLIVIADVNKYQAMGQTKDIIDLEGLTEKFESFGFETERCEGHDLKQVDEALKKLSQSESPSPKALIADTVKGKGVSFMENDNTWHYRRLDQTTYDQAIKEVSQHA